MGEEPATGHGPSEHGDRRAVLKGVAYMAVAGVLVSVMHVIMREVSQNMHPIEIAFFRNVTGFVLLLPFLLLHCRG